jgi:MoxR-like ATPase
MNPRQAYELIAANVQRVIKGKPLVVRLAIATLFAGGHLLIEDVPGLGKTSLARGLARSIGGKWSRIQFTPDLLPGDVTGVVFHPGGIFSNVVLADEVNRGTPKTQSALLEVMAERQATVDAVTHRVPDPFMVLATQNPIEMEGTYRLPEAQLDRFLMRIEIGYPDLEAEVEVVALDGAGLSPDDLRPVIDPETLRGVIAAVRSVYVDEAVMAYAVRLAAATRLHSAVRYGASPRGSIALVRAARAIAATEGRQFVTPDDVKSIARPVLAHRLVLTPDAALARRTVADVIGDVLEETPAPGNPAPGDRKWTLGAVP